jgi:hypothetical protein
MGCLILTGACLPLDARSAQPSISAVMEVSSTNVFQNEEFTLTFVVRINGVRAQKEINVSGLPESQVFHLGAPGELPTRQFVENGQACEVRRSFCRARARVTGPIEIAPTLQVTVLTGRSHFFTGEAEVVPYDLRVQPLTLQAHPLPQAGRPADFSGAVGQFTFDVGVDPTHVAPGALIHVTPRIRGTGFLETVSAPRVSQSPHFRIYDPKPVSAGAGEAAFEQILVPNSTNAPAVPAISFSYFDPGARAYRTITRGPTPLTFVAAAAAPAAFEPYRPPVRETNAARLTPSGTPSAAPAPAGAGRMREWLAVAILAAVLLAIIAAIGAIFPRRRRAIHVALLLVLAAFAAFAVHRVLAAGWLAEPEAVVIRHETARFAPAYSAIASFDLPAGARVRTAEVRGAWAKVSLGRKRGWVPTESLRQP